MRENLVPFFMGVRLTASEQDVPTVLELEAWCRGGPRPKDLEAARRLLGGLCGILAGYTWECELGLAELGDAN